MKKKVYWAKARNPFDKIKSHMGEMGDLEDMPTMINVTAIETPVGVIGDVEDILQADDHIWIGHSNFDITADDIYKIEGIAGVEGLRPMTRYRFQVAIGLMFDEELVKQKIEKAICFSNLENVFNAIRSIKKDNPNLDEDLNQKIQNEIAAIKEKYWAILMTPNGETKVLSTNDLDESFADNIAILYSTFLFVGGYFTSNIGV